MAPGSNCVAHPSLPMDNLERLFREYHGPIVRYLARRLRDSEYKGNSSAAQVLEAARAALGNDRGGYRAEFVQLVERWRALGVTAGERR